MYSTCSILITAHEMLVMIQIERLISIAQATSRQTISPSFNASTSSLCNVHSSGGNDEPDEEKNRWNA